MYKRMTAVLLAFAMMSLAGCQGKAEVAETSTGDVIEETDVEEDAEAGAGNEAETSDLAAIGDVEVEEELFDVEITIPAEFVELMGVEDASQEELDAKAKNGGYRSAVLNDDGSVTFVMSKAQHKAMLGSLKEYIDEDLQKMVGSEEYPHITAVDANDDYTHFIITTTNAQPDMSESMSVLELYLMGGVYGIFSGERAEEVVVDFKNADTGEIISSTSSAN